MLGRCLPLEGVVVLELPLLLKWAELLWLEQAFLLQHRAARVRPTWRQGLHCHEHPGHDEKRSESPVIHAEISGYDEQIDVGIRECLQSWPAPAPSSCA
jgi:hypothetical protein